LTGAAAVALRLSDMFEPSTVRLVMRLTMAHVPPLVGGCL